MTPIFELTLRDSNLPISVMGEVHMIDVTLEKLLLHTSVVTEEE